MGDEGIAYFFAIFLGLLLLAILITWIVFGKLKRNKESIGAITIGVLLLCYGLFTLPSSRLVGIKEDKVYQEERTSRGITLSKEIKSGKQIVAEHEMEISIKGFLSTISGALLIIVGIAGIVRSKKNH